MRSFASLRMAVGKKPMLVAFLSLLGTFLLAWGYLKAREFRFNRLDDPVAVVVAKRDVPPSTRLDESDLMLTRVPRRFLQPGAVSMAEQAAGWITTAPILEGEQVLATKLVALSLASGLAVRIPQGFRALSVEVDDVSGVAGLVRPNDFVDILATFEMEDSTDTVQVATHTLAQQVLVLSVGDDLGGGFDPQIPGKNRKKSVLGGGMFAEALSGSRKNTLTLALTPKQAQTVEFAKKNGTLSFALRPRGEEQPLDLSPATALDAVGFKGRVSRGYREYRGR